MTEDREDRIDVLREGKAVGACLCGSRALKLGKGIPANFVLLTGDYQIFYQTIRSITNYQPWKNPPESQPQLAFPSFARDVDSL